MIMILCRKQLHFSESHIKLGCYVKWKLKRYCTVHKMLLLIVRFKSDIDCTVHPVTRVTERTNIEIYKII